MLFGVRGPCFITLVIAIVINILLATNIPKPTSAKINGKRFIAKGFALIHPCRNQHRDKYGKAANRQSYCT